MLASTMELREHRRKLDGSLLLLGVGCLCSCHTPQPTRERVIASGHASWFGDMIARRHSSWFGDTRHRQASQQAHTKRHTKTASGGF